MRLFPIISDLRFQDIVDILFLSVLVYHLYLWFRGTKAFKALIGLMGLGLIFTIAQTWGLFLTTWMFHIFWQVLVILLVILFQSEIRQVLEKVNPLRMIGLGHSRPEDWISGFVDATYILAQRKIGALMIIERNDHLEELITGGSGLEADPTSELIVSIFQKESALHDGAMIIRDGKIKLVACYLPLSPDEGLPNEWGTRHRAALGISERCDAWVVVVSEERGEISLAREGEMVHIESRDQLERIIHFATKPVIVNNRHWATRLKHLITRNWYVKLGCIALVSVVWLMLAGQQNYEATIRIPLTLVNVPENMRVAEPIDPQIAITVRGLRKDASTLDKRNVQAFVDLSMARFGKTKFRITRDQIILPNDRISVVNITPPEIDFKYQKAANAG